MRSTLVAKWVLGIHLALSSSAQEPAAGAAEHVTDRDALGAMAGGYFHHREQFRYFSCRFRVVKAKAASVDDALAGKLFDPLTYEGVWLVHDDKVRYELVCDPDVLGRAVAGLAKQADDSASSSSSGGMKTASLPCTDSFELRDGSYAARYSPVIRSLNVSRVDDLVQVSRAVTPFNMDVFGFDEVHSPGHVLQQCLDGSYVGQFRGSEEILGVEVLRATATIEEGDHLDYALDPNRGFVLIHTSGTDSRRGVRGYDAFVTDFRQCSHDRWFPERSVVIWEPESAGPFRVQEIKVVELDVDKPPADRAFSLDLPAGTRISVPGGKIRAVHRLPEDKRVGLADLPVLFGTCEAIAKGQLPPATPFSATPGHAWRWVLALSSVVAVASFFLFWGWKRWKMRVVG